MTAIKTSLKTLTAAATLAFASMGFAADLDINADENDIAMRGYDAVSYFSIGKPTKGSDKFLASYKNAIFKFSSKANRDEFKANPVRYTPQYGGYCAFGTSVEKKFDGDPSVWKIVDNKLYLNLNKDVQKRWLIETDEKIQIADETWPVISHVKAEDL
ncbi:YHS domain-containing (seleno)protein [Pelagibaculum spongiae]|uniref:YHS domain-containing protein n=1 Tax=Pelagibaculum spongiae TaxID=2080658 RepID=A0A2V1H599_9GAMM|nr:YHS domain-containing (seleno)protein [Pelagibaculum spongiae]PVZ72377.1 hypothetical protein DC094_05055 [Pelagibaculum spongiae]